jgi:hypothetical protein
LSICRRISGGQRVETLAGDGGLVDPFLHVDAPAFPPP